MDGSTAAPSGYPRLVQVAIAIGLLVAVAILVLIVLFGGGTPSIVARWMPPDTAAYLELRFDLAADQADDLARFVPDLAYDDTTGETESSEIIGAILRGLGAGEVDGELSAWFGGQLGLGHAAGTAPSPVGQSGWLVVATVTDEPAARAWLERTVGDLEGLAWDVTSGVALVGDPGSVRAGVATGGSSSFASRPEVATARRPLGGDQVAFAFVDGAAMATALADAVPEDLPLPLSTVVRFDRAPAWVGAGLRFEDATAIATTVVPHRAGLGISNAASAIPARVPATTLGLLDVHDAGVRLASLGPAIGEMYGQADADRMLRMLGGVEQLTAWIAEAALVVDQAEGDPVMGLVAISTDTTRSTRLLGQLELAARLTGGTVERSDHSGTAVVTVTPGGLGDLLGDRVGSPGWPMPVDREASVSWAVAGDLVIVSPDPGYVATILDTAPETSLSADQTFDDLLDKAGATGIALGWVDIDRARDLMQHRRPQASGEGGHQQGLTKFEAAVGTMTVGGATDRATLVVSVGQDR